MSSSAAGGTTTDYPIVLTDILELQDIAGCGNFGGAYGTALVMPLQTTSYELSQINTDIDVYGQTQSDFEDLANALRSHANDQTFTMTDAYQKVFDKANGAYDAKINDPATAQDQKDKYIKARDTLWSVGEDIRNGKKISQSRAAGASAQISETKGWVIPESKTRDVTSSKVKFLNEELQQGVQKVDSSVNNQFNHG